MHGASWVSAGPIFDCQVRKYPSVLLQGEQEIVGLTRSGMEVHIHTDHPDDPPGNCCHDLLRHSPSFPRVYIHGIARPTHELTVLEIVVFWTRRTSNDGRCVPLRATGSRGDRRSHSSHRNRAVSAVEQRRRLGKKRCPQINRLRIATATTPLILRGTHMPLRICCEMRVSLPVVVLHSARHFLPPWTNKSPRWHIATSTSRRFVRHAQGLPYRQADARVEASLMAVKSTYGVVHRPDFRPRPSHSSRRAVAMNTGMGVVAPRALISPDRPSGNNSDDISTSRCKAEEMKTFVTDLRDGHH